MHCDFNSGQGVVLIGHSMGCSLAALLASNTSPYAGLIAEHVLGFVAICPKSNPPSPEEAIVARRLLLIPGFLFDLWRRYDRRGGIESQSVIRFTGVNSEEETRKLQYRFNEQSKTAVWRRMAKGLLPDYTRNRADGGMPGKSVWQGLKGAVFLAAGESDKVTPAENVSIISEYLRRTEWLEISESEISNDPPISKPSASANVTNRNTLQLDEAGSAQSSERYASSVSKYSEESRDKNPGNLTTKSVISLKTVIFPSPASHALMYAPSTSRVLAGLIQEFLNENVDERLSLGWQLQYLSTEGKWDVKNFAK